MKTILIDCDGVLSDFTGKAVSWLNFQIERSGYLAGIGRMSRLTPEMVTSYDIFKALGKEEWKQKFWQEVSSRSSWCYEMAAYPHAKETVGLLRSRGRLVCVTGPVSGRYWAGERIEWLRDRLGFDRKDIIVAADKSIVHGDVLIEDSMDNLRKWTQHSLGRHGIIWTMPWNAAEELADNIYRADSSNLETVISQIGVNQ